MQFFKLSEFFRSAKAQALGIDNTPRGEYEKNLVALTEKVLDPARKEWGCAINVTSGFRCAELNKAVGGVGKSQHLTGEAADIVSGGKKVGRQYNHDIGVIIARQGHFDQLIFEDCGKNDLLPKWIHVSHSRTKNRGQILKMVGGKYTAITRKDLGL